MRYWRKTFWQPCQKAKEEAIRNDILKNGVSSKETRPALSSLNDELNEVADELREKQKEALISDDMNQYKVKGSEEVWSSALSKNKGNVSLIR